MRNSACTRSARLGSSGVGRPRVVGRREGEKGPGSRTRARIEGRGEAKRKLKTPHFFFNNNFNPFYEKGPHFEMFSLISPANHMHHKRKIHHFLFTHNLVCNNTNHLTLYFLLCRTTYDKFDFFDFNSYA